MNFPKTSTTIEQQIALLKNRGLEINDDDKAKFHLDNISYYRLSAYLLSSQVYNDPAHNYMPWAKFNDVIKLYVFDRELRLIIIDAIERIEVSIRCKLISEYCSRHGNNWYEDPTLFTSIDLFNATKVKIKSELKRAKELFTVHYYGKYTNPVNPPAWMALEVLSFGTLSSLYKNLKLGDAKKEVAKKFGVKTQILESWLEHLAYVRNVCAHHNRLWNRIMTVKPMIPTNTSFQWSSSDIPLRNDKLYSTMVIIGYMLNRVSPISPFKGQIKSLVAKFPKVNISSAGFPKRWQKDLFWKRMHISITHRLRKHAFVVLVFLRAR